jgi:ABC-type dipeptide/oligopeptide/nickel transport system permease component
VNSGVVTFLIRRLTAAVVTLLGVVVILGTLIRLLPGDPARVIAGQMASSEEVALTRARLGLDKGVLAQLWDYISGLFQGDLGTSAKMGTPVWDEIAGRLPYTMLLAAVAIIIALILGIALGTLAALFRGRWIDSLASAFGVAGISMPVYWLGLLFMVLFAVRLKWLPSGGAEGPESIVLPAVTLSVLAIAIISRMTRSALLDVLGQEYVLFASARGLRRTLILWQALRVAFVPVLTVVGLQFGSMLGGAVLTETIFSWPGIGRALVDSIGNRDFPMVQGIVLIFAAMFIAVNLLTDYLYTRVDPRIQLG